MQKIVVLRKFSPILGGGAKVAYSPPPPPETRLGEGWSLPLAPSLNRDSAPRDGFMKSRLEGVPPNFEIIGGNPLPTKYQLGWAKTNEKRPKYLVLKGQNILLRLRRREKTLCTMNFSFYCIFTK